MPDAGQRVNPGKVVMQSHIQDTYNHIQGQLQ